MIFQVPAISKIQNPAFKPSPFHKLGISNEYQQIKDCNLHSGNGLGDQQTQLISLMHMWAITRARSDAPTLSNQKTFTYKHA
jgi:hypothetical protein